MFWYLEHSMAWNFVHGIHCDYVCVLSIMYVCMCVCMYVITFSNRNIFRGFTLVTTFCSKMCHMKNKGCIWHNGKIKERGQCVCEWVKETEERGWRTKVREKFFLVEFWCALAPVSSCFLLVTPTVDHTQYPIFLVGLIRSNSLFLFVSRLICSS